VCSQVMAGAVGLGLPCGHVGSEGIVGSVVPGLTCGHVFSQGIVGSVGPGLLLGHVGSQGVERNISPGLPDGHVGSRAVVRSVVLGLLPAMLVSRAWRELWAQVSRRPCWFPGHFGSCGPWLPGNHIGSQGMVGAVGPGLLLAMLVSGTCRELWSCG